MVLIENANTGMDNSDVVSLNEEQIQQVRALVC